MLEVQGCSRFDFDVASRTTKDKADVDKDVVRIQ